MSEYQIVVSFKADSDANAIEVMEYLDGDLSMAGTPGDDFSTSMPKRHVPARWESISYPASEGVERDAS